MSAFVESLRTMLHDMLAWMEGLAATAYGPWALFVLSFLESSVFPIPPDVLLIALCLADPSQALWFATICSVASVLGGIAGYGLGFWGGRPLVKRFFSEARVKAVEDLYDRYNAWATGIAGLTPLPYKLFTISGGAFAINFRIFVLASIVSRTVRFFAVAGLIYWLGPTIEKFIHDYLDWLSVAFVVLLLLGFWVMKVRAGRAMADADDDAAELVETGGEATVD